MTPRRPHAPRRRNARAFSLVELLFVVALIALLAGLLLVGVVKRAGPATQTKVALAGAKAVADEYEVQTDIGNVVSGMKWTADKPINAAGTPEFKDYGDSANPTGKPQLNIEKFCWAMTSRPVTREMLLNLGKSICVDRPVDVNGDGKLVFNDTNGDGRITLEDDSDLPENGFLELRDGWGNVIDYVVNDDDHPRPYFRSAGPDGLTGDEADLTEEQRVAAKQDNMFSYTLE